MSIITYNDVKCHNADPALNTIISTGGKKTPELNALNSKIIDGESYRYLRKKRDVEVGQYFVKPCDAVCASDVAFEEDRVETQFFKRVMAACDDALDSDTQGVRSYHGKPFSQWDQTRISEILKLNERLATSLYTKEKNSQGAENSVAPPTLGELACFCVNALDGEVNGEKDFAENWADPENPTAAEIAAFGGFTSAFFIVTGDLNLTRIWGQGRQLHVDDAEDTAVKVWNEEKGCYEYTKERTQFMKGRIGLASHTPFDVVEVKNIPCKKLVDGFFFDNIIDTMMSDFYANTDVLANRVLVSNTVLSNWFSARKAQGLAVGGCSYKEMTNAPAGTPKIPMYGDVPIIGSSCIPQTGFTPGNFDRKNAPVGI